MKRLPALIAAGFSAPAIVAGVGVTGLLLTPSGPARAVVDRSAHNWGRVKPGGSVATTFTIRNRGTEPLRFGKPEASCGCAEPTLSAATLAAGESARLRVGFHAPTDPGPVRHTATILTNDPDQPRIIFDLHAYAWRGVLAEPQAVLLGPMRPGETVERVVQLHAPDGGPFRIARVSTDAPHLEAQADQPDVALPVHRVRVTYRPVGPLGSVRGSVRVVTDRADAAWIDLPVGGTVVGRVQLAPDALQIEPDYVGRDVRRTLFLRTRAPDPAPVVASVVVSPPWRLVEHSERVTTGQCNQLTLVVHFPGNEAPRVGMIDLTLAAPEPATYRIPIAARGWDAPLPAASVQPPAEE